MTPRRDLFQPAPLNALAVGRRVQWWCGRSGARRIGTVAAIRPRRGAAPFVRVMEGTGEPSPVTGPPVPALYHAGPTSTGRLDFPADALALYLPPLATCDECGSPEPAGGCDADCPTRDDDQPGPVPGDTSTAAGPGRLF